MEELGLLDSKGIGLPLKGIDSGVIETEVSTIAFQITAPCNMLRKEENLALTTRSYPQYRLECALSGIEAPDEQSWRTMHSGWFKRPVEFAVRQEPKLQAAWRDTVWRYSASDGTWHAR